MALFQGLNHKSVYNNLQALKEASLSSSTLRATDIQLMIDLQQTVLDNLPSHKKHFIAKRSKEDFLKFIQGGGQIIGLKEGEDLVAYSIVEFPASIETSGFDTSINIENIQETAFLKSTLVHPDFRGLGLQKTLIDARLEQAALADKTWAICEVDIQNAASIKNLLGKGFTIRDSGISPVDGMPAVYMYKNLKTAMPANLNNNSLQLVPVEDWKKHEALLSNGHIGIDYFDGFITYRNEA